MASPVHALKLVCIGTTLALSATACGADPAPTAPRMPPEAPPLGNGADASAPPVPPPADAAPPPVIDAAPAVAPDAAADAAPVSTAPRTLAALAAHPRGAEIDPAPEAPGGRGQLVTLRVEEGAVLSIGQQGPFAYPGGQLVGTLTDLGEGVAELFLPAESADIPPLLFIPGTDLVRVDISPRDMRGLVDFCSGAVELPFDARFQPVMLGFPQREMSVETPLTTGTSPGKNTPDRVLTGTPLAPDGSLRLVGIADVPETGDPGVDDFLGLPADARTDMPSRIVFTEGALACP